MNHIEIINKLCKAGFPTFIVGGAVRDFFDGQEPSDFDIVTKATPDQIQSIFKGYKVNTVGKSFGVTIVEGYEIATFRIDRYPFGLGANNCVPVFAENIHEDISRRDFTVNSLALCPISGDYIDDFSGLEDLKNRVVRFVGNPFERIAEDPNRIIRACRFVAKLQGKFDDNTLKAIQESLPNVFSQIKPERISKEIMKAMELEFPSIFFAALAVTGALDLIFPGMEASIDHEHGKWHKETVWEHLMIAGDSISPKFPVVRLAAFLHDVGKPSAFAFHNDGSFVNHEDVGYKMVDKWLKTLKFSNEDRDTITNLVKFHMLGGGSEKLSDKAIRRLQQKFSDNNVNIKNFMRLRIADRTANLYKENWGISDIKKRYSIFLSQNNQEPIFNVNSLALKGGDIIRIFNVTPGPLVGKIQKHLLEFVIEFGFEYNTQETLEKEVRFFIDSTV